MRLFVALPIPDDVATAIGRVQRGLVGAKWSPRDNLHLTLRFMGEVEPHQAHDIDAALGEIRQAPFVIDIGGVGFFGGEEPHAVWLGVKPNAELITLQRQCELHSRRAGLTPAPRAYTPHVTICYLPRRFGIDAVAAFQHSNNLFAAPRFEADRMYLYASHTKGAGPSHYEIVGEYPLLP